MDNIKDMAIIITTDDWEVAYYKGVKFAEGHKIQKEEWIKYGMLLQHDNSGKVEEFDLIDIFIENDEVSDESILWDFPEKIEDLDNEIKALINKEIEEK